MSNNELKYLDNYKVLHKQKPDFGTSSIAFWNDIKQLFAFLNPKTIIDFGCGKGILAEKINTLKGKKCLKYDPAIEEYNTLPNFVSDLIICTDVLEHVPESILMQVIYKIETHSKYAFLNISCRRAGAILPDGSNAHCTIYPPRWWKDILKKQFKFVYEWEIKDNTACAFVVTRHKSKRLQLLFAVTVHNILLKFKH